MSYVAIDGRQISEDMITRWCEAYDKGEFPEGEHSLGKAVMGRPPLSSEQTVTLAIKVPVGMKVALAKKAEKQGVTLSAYARSVLADDILATQ